MALPHQAFLIPSPDFSMYYTTITHTTNLICVVGRGAWLAKADITSTFTQNSPSPSWKQMKWFPDWCPGRRYTWIRTAPSSRLRRRGSRSADAARGGLSDPVNIVLSLPAFGRNLYLDLTRDSKFLSGDFVVEERHKNQSAAVRRLSEGQLCFYHGSIINHTDSLASVSTCGGLTGLIQIGDDSLFIQPVGENNPSQSFSGHKHHLVRLRRSAKSSSTRDADQPSYCGNVQGNFLELFQGYLTFPLGARDLGARDFH
ncbi:hypothetical protein L3Q82_000404 [Scortum barcoo]|uniref:Uncharacterized protein n=1 Tax=Scortum barcoo TaxID=214431 RepID=A0ACB8X946_9TELE|nr:hypothetical protein L3Q82_000404 [Scortum barcoo]